MKTPNQVETESDILSAGGLRSLPQPQLMVGFREVAGSFLTMRDGKSARRVPSAPLVTESVWTPFTSAHKRNGKRQITPKSHQGLMAAAGYASTIVGVGGTGSWVSRREDGRKKKKLISKFPNGDICKCRTL